MKDVFYAIIDLTLGVLVVGGVVVVSMLAFELHDVLR